MFSGRGSVLMALLGNEDCPDVVVAVRSGLITSLDSSSIDCEQHQKLERQVVSVVAYRAPGAAKDRFQQQCRRLLCCAG